jgi:biopolymer transport protein ExbD
MDDRGGLTMISLLDIMTIILVFLIKNFSTDPMQLKASDDLKPPFSSAQIKPAESTVVTVTLKNILVADRLAVTLEGGQVREGDLSGGAYQVGPLLTILEEAVAHERRVLELQGGKRQFEGVITIVADRHVPFKLLSQVMYTAGQAEYGKFKFMVVKAV